MERFLFDRARSCTTHDATRDSWSNFKNQKRQTATIRNPPVRIDHDWVREQELALLGSNPPVPPRRQRRRNQEGLHGLRIQQPLKMKVSMGTWQQQSWMMSNPARVHGIVEASCRFNWDMRWYGKRQNSCSFGMDRFVVPTPCFWSSETTNLNFNEDDVNQCDNLASGNVIWRLLSTFLDKLHRNNGY